MSTTAFANILNDLKNRSSTVRENAVIDLIDFVRAESYARSAESFQKLMSELTIQIFDLVKGSNPSGRLGGIRAIDELIDVRYDNDELKLIQFANYIRMVFPQPSLDAETLEVTAHALGHLVRAAGALKTEFVDFEIKRALEWLMAERVENRRLASVLILKELAESAPTLFYQQIRYICMY